MRYLKQSRMQALTQSLCHREIQRTLFPFLAFRVCSSIRLIIMKSIAAVTLLTAFALSLQGVVACNCPFIYNPVCCKGNGGFQVAPNSCLCTCMSGSVVPTALCRAKEACACPLIFQPVCCQNGNNQVTTANSCICGCNGGTVISDRECSLPGSCICQAIYSPVCCYANGGYSTQANDCLCKCGQGTVVSEGECQSTSSNAEISSRRLLAAPSLSSATSSCFGLRVLCVCVCHVCPTKATCARRSQHIKMCRTTVVEGSHTLKQPSDHGLFQRP